MIIDSKPQLTDYAEWIYCPVTNVQENYYPQLLPVQENYHPHVHKLICPTYLWHTLTVAWNEGREKSNFCLQKLFCGHLKVIFTSKWLFVYYAFFLVYNFSKCS